MDTTRPPGHCKSDLDYAQVVKSLEGKDRQDLPMGDMSDFQMANIIYSESPRNNAFIVYQTAAKERIRFLSVRLAQALKIIDELSGGAEDGKA